MPLHCFDLHLKVRRGYSPTFCPTVSNAAGTVGAALARQLSPAEVLPDSIILALENAFLIAQFPNAALKIWHLSQPLRVQGFQCVDLITTTRYGRWWRRRAAASPPQHLQLCRRLIIDETKKYLSTQMRHKSRSQTAQQPGISWKINALQFS
jgi:hypothetical protein